MAFTPGLRSCYSLVGGIVYFGRMLDKIRLHTEGRLPADYHANLGIGFDGRTCGFLGISYAALKEHTLAGGHDEAVLAWAHSQGGPRSADQCADWNRFMSKLGWRDDRTVILRDRINQFDLVGKPIETFFDLNEFDEGRDPVSTRAWEFKEPRCLLLMGVSGSGKTTVGHQLATTLGWPLIDADDLHPPTNVAKMAAGTPLTDEDRAPWLAAVHAEIETHLSADENLVVACSALKAAYRDTLITDPGRVKLIYLKGSDALLHERLENRQGHFMKTALLPSQLGTLEEPRYALVLDVTATPDVLAARIREIYGL